MTGPPPSLLRRLIPGFGTTLSLLSLLVLLSTAGAGAIGFHSVMQARRAQQELAQQHRLLTVSIAEAVAAQAEITERAVQQLVAVSTLSAVLLFAAVRLFRRRLVRSLQDLSLMVGAVADGDHSARTETTADDEIGRLAQMLDQIAEALQRASRELATESARQDYRARLSRALEFVDDETGLAETVSQTLATIAPDLPAELLLSDRGETRLARFARNPLVPTPDCPVPTPWSCPALRTGRTAFFPSSAVIDTCPRLRHRSEGERAAVCIPVTFMGSKLAVVHAMTRPGDLPNEAVLGRMQVLAEQFGNRVGNLRAFEQFQVQSGLDGPIGLPDHPTSGDPTAEDPTVKDPVQLPLLDHDTRPFEIPTSEPASEQADEDLPFPPPPRHRSPAPPIGSEDLWAPPEQARPAPAGRRVRLPVRPRPRSGPPWAATGAVPPSARRLPSPRGPEPW